MKRKVCFIQPNKVRYNTQKDAETAILILSSYVLRTYFCTGCGGWHLTSKQKS